MCGLEVDEADEAVGGGAKLGGLGGSAGGVEEPSLLLIVDPLLLWLFPDRCETVDAADGTGDAGCNCGEPDEPPALHSNPESSVGLLDEACSIAVVGFGVEEEVDDMEMIY